MVTLPPNDAKVLVIGGGPAGSYAAAVLAREGIDVALVESAKFPRYHIGESLIPSARHYLRFVGVEDIIAGYGFFPKPGAAIKFNQFKREGYTDFAALENNSSWNVVRSEFDHILLNHARTCGVAVYEEVKVISLSFSPTDPSRPISALWTTKSCSPEGKLEEHKGETGFDYLIDASGRAGILSTQYLKNRYFNAALKNIACWGYWRGTATYGIGTARQGAPFFEALLDESGWAWHIPLHNGTTSIGVVRNQEAYNQKGSGEQSLRSPFPPSAAANPTNSTLVARYLANLALAPGILKLITENGTMDTGSVKSATDFSYSAPLYAGNGFRIVGDAGAFIDPFFSSGIHLALTSALSAAASVCASLRGDCSEEEAANWHTRRFSTSYTRFQIVVLSAYKQIRAQSENVLVDVGEDNFDRAFAQIRPLIQGAADVGTQLSEDEIQRSLDFCVKLFDPSTVDDSPEMREGLLGIPEELLDVSAPVIDPKRLSEATQVGRTVASDPEGAHAETEMLLHKINARRVMQAEYAINNLEQEPLEGLTVRLVRGNLGLNKA